MPTVLFINGFKFRFYSNENDEPVHVHISKGGGNAKIWIEPIVVECYAYGFTKPQRAMILNLVKENAILLKQKWNEYFK